ncbi:hypothetical protein I7I51_04169 [Histoplasma capsulatum]|uniref:Uncharacterized protein n=1 Tax=Ajellomyces capsulatus TaxID=5037 RepID=A0A8A1MBW7_AJECA|nr:hypothetical protein I7I51_04169 [Histoplasma capsulatum]
MDAPSASHLSTDKLLLLHHVLAVKQPLSQPDMTSKISQRWRWRWGWGCQMRDEADAGCGWRPRCFSSAEALRRCANPFHRASTDDAKHTRSKRGDMENRTEDPTRRWRKERGKK